MSPRQGPSGRCFAVVADSPVALVDLPVIGVLDLYMDAAVRDGRQEDLRLVVEDAPKVGLERRSSAVENSSPMPEAESTLAL